MPEPIGYHYIISECAPDEGEWSKHKRLIIRDRFEDIMKIYNVLQETNYNFDSYMIEVLPIYNNKKAIENNGTQS